MNLWLSITSNSRLRTDDPFKLTQYPISVLVRTYILLQCLLIEWRPWAYFYPSKFLRVGVLKTQSGLWHR